MRAIAFDFPGNADVLRMMDLTDPRAGAGQVLIRVAYAGINYAEVMYRRGDFTVETPFIPGLEVSGHVEELGEGVTGLRIGQAVAALTLPHCGGYAEYAVAEATLTYPLETPRGTVPLDVAGGFACVVPTAYGLIEVVGCVQPGETVLVHAAAGGVGSVAVQLAKHAGATKIIGVVSTLEKADYARGIGCDVVVAADGFAAAVRAETGAEAGVDLILDSVGGPSRLQGLDLLNPLGRLVVFGNAGGHDDVPISSNRLWSSSTSVLGYSIGALARRRPAIVREHSLAALELIAAGAVRVEPTAVLPLADAAHAHHRLENRSTRGKTVLEVAPA